MSENIQDIESKLTARIKKLEAELAQSEQAGRVKSEYLENLSHDIRTSMNGIIGMTNLVLETELTEEQERFLDMVNSSVDRLLEVVNEVLDYSKIETGQLQLNPDSFDLMESLDHDLYLLRMAAEQKSMRLTCEIDPDVPARLFGDSRRLVQVLTNLVHNGIRYSSAGSVSIKVKNDGYDNENKILLSFSVHDTGEGIELETQKKIFNCFCQQEPCQSVSSDGAGIGLAICAQLVKQMGGEIGLASSPKGSVFWLTVPFREAAVPDIPDEDDIAAARQEESAWYALQGAKVLLAEDETINRVLTETLLAKVGVEVTGVENGARAVAEAESGKYQIILMDVQMPVMDGLEATRRIRALEKGKENPVIIIALTALAMQGDREKCLQAGMDDYLSKPIEKDQLVDMMTQYLTRTALVVDNDIESRQLLVRSLIEHGWNVTMAETGRLAMYEASLNAFDLILLDTETPSLDGLEAVEVLRKLEEYSARQTIILGIGSGNESERERCGRGGYDSVIARPVTGDTIGEMLSLIEL